MDSSETQSKGLPGWLLPLAGVVTLLCTLIAVNFFVKRAVPLKFDLTEDKLHTLAEGTRGILSELDTPVKLTFFASQDKDNVPTGMLIYGRKVDSLLEEYRRAAKDGLLELERVDPEPDSDEEDRARLNELRPMRGNYGEGFYCGITATCLDRKTTIPIVSPRTEQMLEYQISQAIVEVTRGETPTIGVMSALPVSGSPATPFAPQQGPPPWYFHTSLGRNYDPDPKAPGNNLMPLGVDIEAVPEDVDVVLLVHPAGITEQAEFALDQFLLRGGRIVAFLDAFSLYADRTRPQGQPFGGPQPQGTPTSSDLNALLPAWGVEFESNQVVADLSNRAFDLNGRPSPAVMSVTNEGINEEDTLTREMREMLMYMAGTFYIEKKQGIESQVLVESSENAQLVGSMLANTTPERIEQTFKSAEKKFPLVVRLTGSFKTAFPAGKPKPAEAPEAPEAPEGAEAGEEAGEESAEKEEDWLTESAKESSVLLVADSDMLMDIFSLALTREGELLGLANHNLPLLEGAVEQAAGGVSLSSIRTRGSSRRPFKKFKELEANASKKYQEELQQLDTTGRELATKLASLQPSGDDNQMVVVSPEVQAQAREYLAQQVATAKRRRELNRELRKDVRSIENSIKLWNVAGVPVAVMLIALVHLLIRRQKMSAR